MRKCHTRNLDLTAHLLEQVLAGELKVTKAAGKLGVTRRQVYRLRARFLDGGLDGLRKQHKGRPGCGRSLEFRDRVIELVRLYYPDFGPTLAAEKLAERHDIRVSREWLRKAMICAGIWQDRLERQPRVHQLRKPCERRGEIVQVDGSHHRWFEHRGPKCALLVFIDDATSELLHLEFARSESALAYMKAAAACMQKYGKPIAYYSDKHTVFRKSNPNAERCDEPTQFGRALALLKVGMINAETAQAKGRVERANRTLQDRMIKEMRLRGISTIDEANAYASQYIAEHNARFARPPSSPIDAHRPLSDGENLFAVFRWEEPRKLSRDLRVTYDKRIFILEPTREVRALVGREITVCEYADGRVKFEHAGTSLPCKGSFDKLRRVEPQVVNRKLLDSVMEEIRAEFDAEEAALPSQNQLGPPAISDRLDAAFALAGQLQATQPHHRRRNRGGPARLVTDEGLFPEFGLSKKDALIQQCQDEALVPRKLSRQLSFQHRCTGYVVEDTPENRAIIGEYMLVREDERGEVVEVLHQGRTIPHAYRSNRAKGKAWKPIL